MSKGNQSVARAALVLRALSSHGSLGLTEIAKQIGLGKSITYRLLASLKDADLVRVEAGSRRYALGYGLLHMTADWLARIEVRDVALPFLRELRNQTGETVALNIRNGDTRVTVERLDSSFETRFVVDLGRPLPMHVGAAGKSILAFLHSEEVEEIIGRADLTARQQKALGDALETVRQLGYSDTSGERVAGSRSISAPIFNHENVVIASVSVLSLEARMKRRVVNDCRRWVKSTAAEISAEMGANTFAKVA